MVVRRQYNYVAVLDYNLPDGEIRTGPDGVRRTTEPADTKAGGGIFLHVSKGESTAGCVAIPEADQFDGEPFFGADRLPQIEQWLKTGGF